MISGFIVNDVTTSVNPGGRISTPRFLNGAYSNGALIQWITYKMSLVDGYSIVEILPLRYQSYLNGG